MVMQTTSLGRSGLQDWIIQRISAIILAGYTVFMMVYVGVSSHFNSLNHDTWYAFFSTSTMKFASLAALLSLIAHAWIGLWTVTTDYLKPIMIRLPIQIGILGFLFCNLIWGITILWSI